MAVPVRVIPGVPDNGYDFVFVRDRKGELARQSHELSGDFDPDATLPADAQRTEYTAGDRQLWFAPSEAGKYAYIVDGEKVERWPRFDGGCD